VVSAMHGPANCEVIPSFLSSKAAVAAVVGAGQWARTGQSSATWWWSGRPPKAAAPRRASHGRGGRA